jgi:hypothetical protein
VLYQGRRIRQRLLAQSDVERSQTYEFCGPPTLPVTGFQATLRITPVIDGNRAFVEWWANFDCEAASRDELVAILRNWFGKWLESPRESMGVGRPGSRLSTEHCPVSRYWADFDLLRRNIGLFGRFDQSALAVAFAVRIWHRSAGRR